MNKQALAFLTMFSMVLMLSVYYVTLPNDDVKSVMKQEASSKKDSSVSKTKDTSKNSKQKSDTSKKNKATTLQEEIDQKKESEINKQSQIVANTNSDDATKSAALAAIDTLKQQKNLQKTVMDGLVKAGYNSAVEINDTTCIVNVFDQKNDKALAKKILVKTAALTNNKYLIEVAFK